MDLVGNGLSGQTLANEDAAASNNEAAQKVAEPIAVIVTLEVRKESTDEFLDIMAANAEGARAEPGCLRFDLLQDSANPRRFVMYELFESDEALALHKETAHCKNWGDFQYSSKEHICGKQVLRAKAWNTEGPDDSRALCVDLPVAILLELEIRSECMEEFLKVMELNATGARAETGCLRFDLLRSQDHPCRFASYEVFRSVKALQAHKETLHCKRWGSFQYGSSRPVLSKSFLQTQAVDYQFSSGHLRPKEAGRFTSRLRCRRRKSKGELASSMKEIRPDRLGGPVDGVVSDPLLDFTARATHKDFAATAPGALGHGNKAAEQFAEVGQPDPIVPSRRTNFSHLPAFQYLDALVEAVETQSSLPSLRSLPSPVGRVAPMPGTLGSTGPLPSSSRPAGSGARQEMPYQPLGQEIAGTRTPRVAVTNGSWSLRPQEPVTHKFIPAGAAPLGYVKSGLRGTSISRKGAGAAATALWVNTEVARMRAEAQQSKSLGAAAAFMLSNGPEHMEHISTRLTYRDPAR
eukprot:TRINITY_DN40119_c0_g1_i1.p1 TRINITY_DN40119_c0_g1~~TRINITY_DN40119_c0_g1_i1.p1  ORF type:complete len:521 (+),score=88.62 TRINITY_DN40119_c0_g1_i1:161-1723(+)